MKHVLQAVQAPFDEEVAHILNAYPKRDGYLLNLFRVFANSQRFLVKGVSNLLDKQSPLSLREREIVILTVTAMFDCEYEWGVHVAGFAKSAKLTEEQIYASRHGNHLSECWSQQDALLIKVVNEFGCHGQLSTETKDQFECQWQVDQQLEIMALCGNYQTVCYVANTAALKTESFAAKFPKRLAGA